MITINLITKGSQYTTIEVNGKRVIFDDKVLTDLTKEDLTAVEEKAAIWFVNSTLRIKSSILYDGTD